MRRTIVQHGSHKSIVDINGRVVANTICNILFVFAQVFSAVVTYITLMLDLNSDKYDTAEYLNKSGIIAAAQNNSSG